MILSNPQPEDMACDRPVQCLTNTPRTCSIVQMLELVMTEDTIFATMELMLGGELLDHIGTSHATYLTDFTSSPCDSTHLGVTNAHGRAQITM